LSAVRTLIVNADDFGFTRDVNQGIVEAHQRGILTAATLMATGAAFDDAVRLAHANPTLDIGCHLVLVGQPPYPPTIAQLIPAVALGRIKIYEEFQTQVRRILDADLQPTHLDTHKHTHLLPSVLDAVARISQDFQIPWVRRPFDFERQPCGVNWTNRAMSLMRPLFDRVLPAHDCRSTDYFSGFTVTGRYSTEDLLQLIQMLPEGSTEFMCHPGICGPELRAASTRLKDSRQQELEALTEPAVREALDTADVRLANYRDLQSDIIPRE
jgi:chitin disaccharide deacetylase